MHIFIKKFSEWFICKLKFDAHTHIPPLFNEGEIWWCHIGVNIGSEICGKGPTFDRPVLILRKLDTESFIGLPMIGKMKHGTWYVPLSVNDQTTSVFLAQVRYFDYRRLDNKMATLTKREFSEILEKFIRLFRNIPRPPSEENGRTWENPKT